MKIDKKIQIIVIMTIIAIALVAIGISANEIINTNQYQKYQGNNYCTDSDYCPQPYCNNYNQQYQGNIYCPNTDDCPQPYCYNYQQQSRSCQSGSGCGWRN